MSLLELLRDVRDGEDSARAPAGLAAGEGGLLSFVAALTILLFLSLAILLGNATLIVNQKVASQNTADAVAVSSATQMARGMNAVAGVQHLMGELLALVVVHNAIGGDRLPDPGKQDTADEDRGLEIAKTALDAASMKGSIAIGYDSVKKEVEAEAALLTSYKRLKIALAIALGVEAAGHLLKLFPLTAAAGAALIAVAAAVEAFIFIEWLALKAMEIAAKAVAKLVKLVFDRAPKATDTILQGLVDGTADQMAKTADGVSRLNRASWGLVWARDPFKLPVMRDPLSTASSEGEMKKSQLVRASWPWVAYHRSLLMDLTGWMIFSGFKGNYKDETEKFMLKKSYEIYSDKKVYFLVMEGLTDPDAKGKEVWTTSPAEAEQRFAVLGFAYAKADEPWGGTLFKPAKMRDMVTYAQAMVYNANDQRPGAPGRHQQDVGWDTLNWQSPVSRHNAYEFPHSGSGSERAMFPQVRLNWQAKLIPVTFLGRAKKVKPPFPDWLRNVDENSPLAKTH
jgi:hypothetical protein